MARRRRGAEPPVSPSYGTPDVRWHPSRDHDAVQVAALHLQHLVLCEIRRQLGGGWEAAAAHLSRLLGINLRTAQRITSGEHLLRADELVELASLFGDDVLDVIPRTVIELFPEAYRSYLGDWTPGSQQLPAFVPPPVQEVIDWNGAVADLGDWLADELTGGRTGLVSEAVIAHHVAAFLADEAIPQQPPDGGRHARHLPSRLARPEHRDTHPHPPTPGLSAGPASGPGWCASRHTDRLLRSPGLWR